MSPREAKRRCRIRRDGLADVFTCECGLAQTANDAMPWCQRCGVEYSIGQAWVTLLPARMTARFQTARAWHKALIGARMGATKEAP